MVRFTHPTILLATEDTEVPERSALLFPLGVLRVLCGNTSSPQDGLAIRPAVRPYRIKTPILRHKTAKPHRIPASRLVTTARLHRSIRR